MKLKIASHCLATLLGFSFAGSSLAAGFQLLEQNASGLGNAYAGSAVVAENASTIFFNPAGMTQLKARDISVGVNMIRPSFKFTDEGSSSGSLNGTGTGGDAGGWNTVPNLYASVALDKKWFMGVGVSVPFGLETSYDQPWVGGAQSQTFALKTLNINPSVAYQFDPQLSFGVGINAQRLDATYERIVGTSNAVFAGSTAKMEASGWGMGWNTGLLYMPGEHTRIGLSYRSQVHHTIEGDLNVTGPSPALNTAGSSGMKANIHLPDTWTLSASQKMGNVEVLGDVQRIGWSSIPKVDIVRTNGASAGAIAQTLDTHYRDTWRVAFGANYRLNGEWKLKSGLAWDQTPVRSDETRLVSLPDSNRTWLSLGAQWAFDKDIMMDVGAAYLKIAKSKINNDQTASGRGKVVGSYEGNVLIFGLQYSQSF